MSVNISSVTVRARCLRDNYAQQLSFFLRLLMLWILNSQLEEAARQKVKSQGLTSVRESWPLSDNSMWAALSSQLSYTGRSLIPWPSVYIATSLAISTQLVIFSSTDLLQSLLLKLISEISIWWKSDDSTHFPRDINFQYDLAPHPLAKNEAVGYWKRTNDCLRTFPSSLSF